MASPLTHAVVAMTAAAGFRIPASSFRYWLVGIACSEIPDLDAIGFWIGVPYGALLGHRGLTHSILFALLLSWMVTRWADQWGDLPHGRLWSYLFLATMSHGVLDALTDGGLGVAFFSPFDQTRYFFPFRPIQVSSMSLRDVWGPHGVSVLVNELVWVWIPCGLLAVVMRIGRAANRSIQRNNARRHFVG